MAAPPFLQPFVVPVAEAPRRREGSLDVYSPITSDDEPQPAIVFVHGGPVPADLRPTPRDWPVYVGYGSLAASRGVVGVTVDHGLHSPADFASAADDVASAVAEARALAEVDPDRVALWFFSGGGLLSAGWLAEPPTWLRCVALTYPVLAALEDWHVDERFRPAEAIRAAGSLPVLLTRVGRERPDVAANLDAFTASAERHGIDVTVITVPDGQHGFDMLDHVVSSRTAVDEAMTWVTGAVRR